VSGIGLTVPGGDPAALRQLAAQLRTTAQRSGSLGSNTSDLTDAITSDAQWTGSASNSFSTFSANLSEGISAAESPLTRIADAVEHYANVLDVAQQKAQTANAIFQTAQDDPTGSLISTAEQYGQDAMDALDALQQAGDQAAGQVDSAADDLQVGSLFGPQGQVTSWAGGQPSLGTEDLWQPGDAAPGQTEIFPVEDGLGLGIETIPADDGLGTGTETIPVDDGLGIGAEIFPVDDGLGPQIETIPEGPGDRSSTTLRMICLGLTARARFIPDRKASRITCLLTGLLRTSYRFEMISREVSRPGRRSRSTREKILGTGQGSTRRYNFSGKSRRN
jgi:uncharacterized protein YukE